MSKKYFFISLITVGLLTAFYFAGFQAFAHPGDRWCGGVKCGPECTDWDYCVWDSVAYAEQCPSKCPPSVNTISTSTQTPTPTPALETPTPSPTPTPTPAPTPTPTPTLAPSCNNIGSRSEGWYQNNTLIKWANCNGCVAECKATDTKSEGWYNSCDDSLIKYEKCAEETPTLAPSPSPTSTPTAPPEPTIKPSPSPTQNPTPTPVLPCSTLWWYDNTHPYCQQEQFCGAYIYLGLHTFDTEAECKKALPTPTPTPIPTCDDKSYISCNAAHDFGTAGGEKSDMCGSAQYYKITIPTEKTCTLKWTVIPAPDTGVYDKNYDLYANWLPKSCPEQSSYEAASNQYANYATESLEKAELPAGTYYALVQISYPRTTTKGYSIKAELLNCSLAKKPEITIVSPNGDEKWQAETTQEIRWTATKIDKFKIGLYKSGNNTTSLHEEEVYDKTITPLETSLEAANVCVEKNCKWSWKIETDIAPYNYYKITVYQTPWEQGAPSDISDNYFSIIAPKITPTPTPTPTPIPTSAPTPTPEIKKGFDFISPKPNELLKEKITMGGKAIGGAISAKFKLTPPSAGSEEKSFEATCAKPSETPPFESICKYELDTTSIANGKNYKLYSQVNYPDGTTFVSESITISVYNPQEDIINKVSEFTFISPPSGTTISGALAISGKVEGATSVEFYLRQPGALNYVYLGGGNLKEGKWQYQWDTTSTPNGTYNLYAKITNQYGQYFGFPIEISVKNEMKRDVEKEEKIKTQVGETENKIAEGEKMITEEKNKLEALKQDVVKMAPQEKKEASKEIKQLTSSIEEKEKIKTETIQELAKDSDGDGLSDADEVKRGTNPLAADTDGDGYPDGVEVANGYDPLNPSPAAKVVFEDPKTIEKERPEAAKEITKSEILKIEKVELVPILATKITEEVLFRTEKKEEAGKETPAAPAQQKQGIKLQGRALPNSFITLYIYSSPVIVTVKTDEDGNWAYVYDRPLEEGKHEVYITVHDNQGKIVAKSEKFEFVKTASAVAAVSAAAPEISPIQKIEKNYTILFVSLIILFIGIALIAVGLTTTKKNKSYTDLKSNKTNCHK